MEILLLFILNIFTGALIYLLLSLKIERNSSTFQEQKLRKEMGEIITEFNATAERNITLLESRISALKRLMGETGNLKSMDVTLEYKPDVEKIVHDRKPAPDKIKKSLSGDRIITKNAADIAGISFSGMIDDKGAVNGSNPAGKQAARSADKKDNTKNSYMQPGIFAEEQAGSAYHAGSRGSRLDFISDDSIDIHPEDAAPVQFENPADLFQTAENKYSLIAELHGKGYSVEDLAAYSGLPAGEVRLVISLNK